MRRVISYVIFLGVLSPWLFAHHIKTSSSKPMTVTTASPKARDLYERAMTDYENEYLERANLGWRAAVEADPNFALAHAWIAFNSRDPEEARASREKAKALAPKTSAGEQLMIRWITSVQEGNSLAGIAALNDLLEMYPKDKRLFYLGGNWMMGEEGYERAGRLLEKALAIDKSYPPALNDMGYVFAHEREFYKAIGAMDRYVEALPGQPNPQDSYAEILRMSGDYDEALEHYRASLAIDPKFEVSQLGLGDTYSLMGEQVKARVEYDKVLQMASTPADRLDYGLQKAMTWVRENNLAEADKAFFSIAFTAHDQKLVIEEAQAYRMMAMYTAEDGAALKHLDSAEDALQHSADIAQSDRDNELARILRVRVQRAMHAGNTELATKTVARLEEMTGKSRSRTIQTAYDGSAGLILFSQQKYADAIAHLTEDHDNPYSMQLLAKAYAETGDNIQAKAAEMRLQQTHTPTMEQALVVSPKTRLAAKE
jgi:tetratricopeptide (TPR) repeat protein